VQTFEKESIGCVLGTALELPSEWAKCILDYTLSEEEMCDDHVYQEAFTDAITNLYTDSSVLLSTM
jgi:hypothetical protein